LASKHAHDSFKEQYKRMYDYIHKLLRSNPKSTMKVKVEENDGMTIFKKFYICLKTCKDSFMSCRLIIGCFFF